MVQAPTNSSSISPEQDVQMYKDNKSHVKPHAISVGDRVLLKQKPQKHKPPDQYYQYCKTSIRHRRREEKPEVVMLLSGCWLNMLPGVLRVGWVS